MTYKETVCALSRAGVTDAEYEASLLFEEFAGVGRAKLLCDPETDCAAPGFLAAVGRRMKREPLQYILGSWYFRGIRFELSRDTLIPRPDTETLVELAVSRVPRGGSFLDVGTGSGAIAVSVLKERPDLRCVAVDISPGALKTASINAANAGVADRCRFLIRDALDGEALSALGSFDAVLSNPPYVRSGEIDTLEPELSYEPRAALDGGGDGYLFYRSIIPSVRLNRGGIIIFETGAGMAEGLCGLGGSFGFECEIFRDLSSIGRDVIMRKTNET